MKMDDIRMCEMGLLEGCLRMAEMLGGINKSCQEYSRVVVPGSFFYSRVYDFKPRRGLESIRALKNDIVSGEAPDNLLIYNSVLTPSMERNMLAEGFRIFAEQTGMVCELSNNIELPKANVIEVEYNRVREWAKCVNTAIGKEDDAEIFEIMHRQSETSFYGVEQDGKIVSTILVATFGDIACLHEGGTYTEYRGRGYISDLIRRAMLDAKEQGFKKIVLQASPMGRPVYDKLGFKAVGQLKHWSLSN